MSNVERLPAAHRDAVDRGLRAGRHQTEVLADVNPRIEADGETPISRSGMSRYSRKWAETRKRVHQAREAAKALTRGLGEHDGEIDLAVNAVLQAVMFDLSQQIEDQAGADDIDLSATVATVRDAALAQQRLARAEETTRRRMERLAHSQAERVDEVAKAEGLSEPTVDKLRAALTEHWDA